MAKKKKPTKNPSVLKFWAIWNVSEAILLIIAGALSIVVGAISVASPDNSDLQEVANTMTNILPFVLGAFVVMDAAMRVVISFTKFRKDSDESSMLVGAFEGTVGAMLMIFFNIFTQLVASFIAIFMILVGVLLIVYSIVAIVKSRARLFVPILEIVFSAVLIAIGTAILILYYKDSGDVGHQRLVLIITGGILAVSGVVFLIMTAISRKKQKKEFPEEVAPAAIEVEDEPEVIEDKPEPEVIDFNEPNEDDPLPLPEPEEDK